MRSPNPVILIKILLAKFDLGAVEREEYNMEKRWRGPSARSKTACRFYSVFAVKIVSLNYLMCTKTCLPIIPSSFLTETLKCSKTVNHWEIGPQLAANWVSKHVTVIECIRDTETNQMQWPVLLPSPPPFDLFRTWTHFPDVKCQYPADLQLTLKPPSLCLSVMVTIWL